MDDQINQPLPQDQSKASPEVDAGTETKEETPKSFGGKVTKLLRESKKAKLIAMLVGFTVVAFLLVLLTLLTRRPSPEGGPLVEPTPQPTSLTPTPEPAEIQREIGELRGDIDAFDPTQKDFQPPVVDLEIGL